MYVGVSDCGSQRPLDTSKRTVDPESGVNEGNMPLGPFTGMSVKSSFPH